ncbi:MAG: hypothetical protein LBD13_00395 [Spirochaetaceae bacterium]|jgi:uncharacterized membrane protein|nr:hypothetical protein [Spirochaetaceae bacterium]
MGKKKVTALAAAMLSAAALLAAESTANGFFYAINNGQTITITGYFGDLASLVIPERIQDMPVTAIGNSAFIRCARLTSITIHASIDTIGE